MAHKIMALGVGVVSILAQQVWAQDGGTSKLGSYGNTQLQKDTGDAVTKVCQDFIAAEANPATPLFATCRSMVQTANELSGSGPTFDSRGLDQAQLAASLQQIATEEFGATQTMASDLSSSRMDPVITRLVELRAGARGFSVVALLPGDTSEALAANGVSNSSASLGGAAGDDLGSRLGGFFNASYGTGDNDGTDRTNSFDFDSYNITAGMDYRISDDLVVGGAFNYYEINSDFDKTPEVSGGSTDVDGWGASIFGTWYKDNLYVDAIAGYASSDYDTDRKIFIPSSNPSVPGIVETATASPESDDYTFGIGAGYNFNHDALNWGPYFRATYIKVEIDDYREKGAETSGLNLAVKGQDFARNAGLIPNGARRSRKPLDVEHLAERAREDQIVVCPSRAGCQAPLCNLAFLIPQKVRRRLEHLRFPLWVDRRTIPCFCVWKRLALLQQNIRRRGSPPDVTTDAASVRRAAADCFGRADQVWLWS